jgi:hypothetical protein
MIESVHGLHLAPKISVSHNGRRKLGLRKQAEGVGQPPKDTILGRPPRASLIESIRRARSGEEVAEQPGDHLRVSAIRCGIVRVRPQQRSHPNEEEDQALLHDRQQGSDCHEDIEHT